MLIISVFSDNRRCYVYITATFSQSILSLISGLYAVANPDSDSLQFKIQITDMEVTLLNRFLVGLNGAGVLYYFFCSKDGIACGGTKILLSGMWSL